MGTKILHRRDNATNLASVNPVLGEGEIAYNTTDGSFRIGDGTHTWSALNEYQYGALHYMGTWDAGSGSYPTTPEQGQYYVVSGIGTVSTITYGVDDWIVYNGIGWNKIDNQVYQPLDTTLTALAGVTTTADKLIYATAADTFTTTDLTAAARTILDDTTTAAMLTTLSAASSTTAARTIYVDKAATGAGTGVDKTNAFTTWAAAIASLPAIINHVIVIKGVKGDTPYNETLSIQRTVSAGSITIRGEYYWYGTNAGTKTGKFDLGTGDFGYADRAQIADGDVVWMTKWSGTVYVSTPSESIIDTVASVSGAEVTLTTNTTKELDTTWTYRIVKTIINGTIINKSGGLTIQGLKIYNTSTASGVDALVDTAYTIIINCMIDTSAGTGHVVRCFAGFVVITYSCLIAGSASPQTDLYLLDASFEIGQCILSGYYGVRGINASRSRNWSPYNHILTGSAVGISMSYNSVAYFTGTKNEATTPKSPASSSDYTYLLA